MVPELSVPSRLTDYLASHFSEIGTEELEKLSPETLKLLLSNNNVDIANHWTLYQFILNRAKDDRSFLPLLQYLRHDKLVEASGEHLERQQPHDGSPGRLGPIFERLMEAMTPQICTRMDLSFGGRGPILTEFVGFTGTRCNVSNLAQDRCLPFRRPDTRIKPKMVLNYRHVMSDKPAGLHGASATRRLNKMGRF